MLQKKLIFSIFFCAVFFLFSQTNAFACSCAAKPTVLDSFESANLVVVTRTVSVEKVREKQREYDIGHVKSTKMAVEKVFKGNVKVGDEITFAQGGGADCIWTFDEDDIGKRYLFYLDKPAKGHPFFDKEDKKAQPMFYAVTCGRSTNMDGAADDLSYLNNMDKLRGKTRISGTLESWSKAPGFADLKIKIIGKNKTYETKTDKNGFYEIYDLPAGEYLIEPETPKGWKINNFMLNYSPSYPYRYGEKGGGSKNQVPIVLQAKRHAALDLLFVIDNAVRGKITSPVGKPMKDVCVMAVSTELKEGDYRGEFYCTNEKGEFEIDEISPDNYILVVNDDGKISSSEPFGTLFYPGVSDRRQAGVIAVDAGVFVNDVNIQIPKTEELTEISGRLLFSDGKPVAGEYVEFHPLKTPAGFDTEARAETDQNGRFTLKILKGAEGKIFGEMYTYIGEFEKCAELEKIIKKTGRTGTDVKTNEIEIQGGENLTEIKLIFPFPFCVKAKD